MHCSGWFSSSPDFETVAGILAALTTFRPTHLHATAASPQMQCHPMPWERLINICIQVILVPNPPFLPCHLFCLGIASSGWDSEEAAGQTESSAWKLPPPSRRFSSVQQFSRLTTISSICVSCHHNGLPGLRLRALCHWFLGSRQTPQVHRNMIRPGLNAYCDVFLQDPC